MYRNYGLIMNRLRLDYESLIAGCGLTGRAGINKRRVAQLLKV